MARRRSGCWKAEEEIEEGAGRREDSVAYAAVWARAFGIAGAGHDCARRFWDARIFSDAADAERDQESEGGFGAVEQGGCGTGARSEGSQQRSAIDWKDCARRLGVGAAG